MFNLIKYLKIKNELKTFQKFKMSYSFEYKELCKKDDESLFFDDICIREGNENLVNIETEQFVNVGYANKGSCLAKVLSNLFPYKFYFRGFIIESIEGVIQGLKIKDKKSQKLCFSYSGLNSNRIKACCDYDWRLNQSVYFQGKKIKRDSKEYQNFIDELYVSLLSNKLFANALKNVGERYIMHSIGNENKQETLLSRYEFEYELNCLKDYVLSKK